MRPPTDAPNMKHRDGSMAGLCGHWARRRRICRRQALPRYVDFEAPGISTRQREVDIGAAVEGWRATTPERAKAMTPVGNDLARDFSQRAPKLEPPHAADPYNAAGGGVSASGNGTSPSPRETTRTPSPSIGEVFFAKLAS